MQAVTETSNVFLRWARLKQEAMSARRSEVASMSAEAVAPRPGTDGAENEPFDPASLPSIDSIAADTDISAFLQRNVPVELTRTALRQAWVRDPAIRDFVGIAENQWDFNDPNGIPGFGPLGTVEGQAAFLSQVPPSVLKMPDLLAEEVSPVARNSNVVHSERSAADQNVHGEFGELHSSGVSSHDICARPAGAGNEDAVGQSDASFGLRRYGSALPR